LQGPLREFDAAEIVVHEADEQMPSSTFMRSFANEFVNEAIELFLLLSCSSLASGRPRS
jgi:hypothetical protein